MTLPKSKIDFEDVITYYKSMPHQKVALEWLAQSLTLEQITGFYERWYFDPEIIHVSQGDRNIEAFLQMVRVHEGTASPDGYNIMFTGKRFSSFADHPRILQCAGELCSDAAGAWQFLSTTWDGVASRLGLKDFTPYCQRLAAIQLLHDRNAYWNIFNGEIMEALNKTSWEWASLPPGRYGQPSCTYAEAIHLYKERGGLIA